MKGVWMFLWSILAFSSWAQQGIEVQYRNKEQLDGGVFLGKDIFDSSYFIKERVFILKRTDFDREFQNLSLGDIDYVDIVNPLQISLFYKNFNTIVLLDKELAVRKMIQITAANPQLTAGFVSMSSQNRLWVWDDVSSQLGHLSIQSEVFTPLTTPFLDVVKYRFSDVNYFYWISESNQLYYSDIYGKVSLRYQLPIFDDIQIINKDKILYLKDNILYYLDLKTAVQSPINLKEKSISRFFFNTQILSIFADQEIKNYHITLP